MKSRPWGRKTPSASTHRPRRLSHPPRPRLHFRARVHTSPVCVCTSPSAFTLPPHRLPRPPQSNRHPAAAVIHNGLSTEKLSTSLPAALCKTFSPSRLRTRIYNISFARRPLPGRVRAAPEKSPRRCDPVSRAAERRVGGRRQRRTPPRAVPALARLRPSPCPSTAESLCAKAECTRQSSPLPVRSPRVSPHTTELPPAYGRITVRKGGSAQGNPRPCPCVLPATARLRPSPCLLMGESLCAKAEVHKANPAPARAFSPRQLVYGRAPARLWSNCRAQRRKCTRPTPPPPVRSPRVSLSTAALPPADGRSAERRVGEDEGKGGRPLAQQPAPVCLPPRPRRLNGHPASAGGRENDRMAHRRTTTPTHRTQRGNDTCTIRVP